MRTLLDLLYQRTNAYANNLLYACQEEEGEPAQRLTYEDLARRVCALGEHLVTRKLQGERVLLFYPSGPEYIVAFLACLYAGIIPVPLYPPRKNQSVKRVLSVITDAQPAAILTSGKIFRYAPALFTETSAVSLQWIVTDAPLPASSFNWRPRIADAGSLAFLQYTSGSVGDPKGVMVTHENLLRNQKMLFRMFGEMQSPVMVSWLPIFHDMGLILFMLQPLYAAGCLHLMSPADFLQKPYRWLKTISDHKADCSGAPNFAYELCIRRITPEQKATLDLSSWKVAQNAAEPVNAHTLERFYRAFKDCGFRKNAFYPCYGLAEATLGVSGEKKDAGIRLYHADSRLLQQHILQETDEDDPHAQILVDCGMPVMQDVVIVDPSTLQALEDETIGEIWISGSNVAKGYWNRPEQTAATFEAVLPQRPGLRFLRTGDLGFMKDGGLYITGRLKELIIVRGRNIYPQDVERISEAAHEALQPFAGAAFAVTADGTEQLVIVQELKRAYARDPDVAGITNAIRLAVSSQLDVPLHAVWLIRPSSIPKTSSGKIQRLACRKAFLEQDENTLLVLGKWQEAAEPAAAILPDTKARPVAMITDWLKKAIAQQCGIPLSSIQADDALDKFGLDSMAAAHITNALSEWMGIQVPPTVVYDYPDIQSLSAWLHQALHGSPLSRHHATVPAYALNAAPVAVVGIGCRFPGAHGPQAFWELIQAGSCAVHELPAGRWPGLQEADYKGYEWIRQGGFLDNIDAFDAGHFGIPAAEAAKMDPQQRFLLEVSWEALEDANIAPASLAGHPAGVFVGISANDYARLQPGHTSLDAWYGTGNAASIAANRLSYFYDLRGPSMAVDTACSSSLVAVHHACNSLQRQECSIALAAGVNIMAAPDLSLVFAKAGMLSPDGQCKTFDAAANGYVRGEGCGVLVLKRLTDAVNDGDKIYGVIKGSALNQDGRTNGLTAPNGPAQEEVLRRALASAGIAPHQVNLLEAHGTGTALGDPIEMNALLNVLAEGRAPDDPCYVGAVKTNIGHLEAAAGIAGLIKVLLCLHHKQATPHTHIRALNPHIPAAQQTLVIPTQAVPLTGRDQPLIAGVSAFGFGGTNAHVIVEEHKAAVAADQPAPAGPCLVAVSAGTEKGIQERVRQLMPAMDITEPGIRDMAATLMNSRNHLSSRMAWIAADKDELKAQWQAYLQPPPENSAPLRLASPRLAMLFTGQGAQYAMMGHALYKREAVFRETMDACSRYLLPYIGVSLAELLYVQQDDQRIHQTAVTQPALFALELSLARLWASCGIVPDAVMGHSVGEIAAACVAGVFSMEDGLRLIAARGALMQSLPAGGQMWALMATPEQVQPFLQEHEKHIAIASVNAPNQVVIAGDGQRLQQVVQALQNKKIMCSPLKVSHAFHSPLMEPIIDSFLDRINDINYNMPQIPLLSNVSGTWAGKEITTPAYWASHILAPVLFSKSIQQLQREGFNIFLEAGPHPVLNSLARQTLGTNNDMLFLPGMVNKSDNERDWLQSLAALYTQGYTIKGAALYPPHTFKKINLPLYPFKRESYWLSQEDMLPPAVVSPPLQPAELIWQQQWIESSALAANGSDEASVVLAITDDIPLLHVLLQNGFGKKKQLVLLVPESLKDTLLPDTAREHQIIYHKGDSVELYRSTLQDILQHRPVVCNIILAFHLHTPAYTPTETPVKVQYPYYNRVLHVLQAISSLSAITGEGICRLLLIIPASSQVSGMPVYPPAAVLAAMMRSARLEMPELKIKTIEVSPGSEADWKAILHTELAVAAFTETDVAWQQGRRYVSRLQQSTVRQLSAATLFDPALVWLISGGTSTMAPDMVDWMLRKGARHFLLLSRNPPQDAYLESLQRQVLAANGSISWCLADVSAHTVVEELQQQLLAIGKPLGGIFHLAGVLKNGPLHNLSWQDMEPVLAPKVAGTLHLHQLSLQHKPVYFVCFSSLAALIGGFYQCGYAAANAFMDAFAAWRLQQGLPALSINWGPWEGEGMAKAAMSHKIAGVEIVHKTTLQQNLEALEIILANRLHSAAVVNFNRTAAGRWLSSMPFLQQVTVSRHKENTGREASFAKQLLACKKEEQHRQLSAFITRELQQLIGAGNGRTIGQDQTFAAMGMDSMMTIVLQQKLQQWLDLRFSAAAIYNYNTIGTLSSYLLQKLRTSHMQHAAAVAPSFTLSHTIAGRHAEIDALDEEAATARLEEVLKKYKTQLL